VKGVLVGRVAPDGPGEKAGLQPTQRDEAGDIVWGDLIVAVGGRAVESVDELLSVIEGHEIGDKVKLEVVRGLRTTSRETQTLTVQLEAETESR
jgi:S1-C subfamily serine protease